MTATNGTSMADEQRKKEQRKEDRRLILFYTDGTRAGVGRPRWWRTRAYLRGEWKGPKSSQRETISALSLVRRCEVCGADYPVTRRARRFCSRGCKKVAAYWRRKGPSESIELQAAAPIQTPTPGRDDDQRLERVAAELRALQSRGD